MVDHLIDQGKVREAAAAVNLFKGDKAKKIQPRVAPLLLDEFGNPVLTAEDRALRWQRHFATIETAEVLTPEELYARWKASHDSIWNSEWEYDSRDVPTLIDVDHALVKAVAGRSNGNDGIPNLLLHACHGSIARLSHPLYVKSSLHIAEPLAWHGGLLASLCKGSGAPSLAPNSRGVLVSDGLGKAAHRMRRSQLVPYLAAKYGATQCGSLMGRSADIASHFVREVEVLAKARGQTAIFIFCDLIAAFYSVIRQALFESHRNDEEVARLFSLLDLPPSSLDNQDVVAICSPYEGVCG